MARRVIFCGVRVAMLNVEKIYFLRQYITILVFMVLILIEVRVWF